MLAVLVVGGIIVYAAQRDSMRNGPLGPVGDDGQRACTMDAKICPDGSAVGRTGPNCEFAACPGARATTGTGTTAGGTTAGTSGGATTGGSVIPTVVTARIGETISMLGISAKILSVAEDSRCPSDVQCVWAGTVRVNVRASYGMLSKDVVLTLGAPYELNGHSVTLTAVSPERKSTSTINSSDYVFTFAIK